MERIDAVKTTFFGKGAIRLLIPELRKMNIHRAIIITDVFLYETGVAKKVGDVLIESGVEYAIYYNVKPNPTVDIVNECIEVAKTLGVDMLVAVGGGSAIDTAKAVSIVVANGGKVEDYEGVSKSSKPGIPIVAINTTAGTGSECTTFYIVTNPVTHGKMAMVDSNAMVSIAVNDVDFMSSMPKGLTASTGMDALTHAVEALFSCRSTPVTDKDAIWAMEQVYKFLPRAVDDGTDEEARTMMAYAENIAGMAFSNAGLGMVHAMAHALGGLSNLPHGACNAVLLPYVEEFNGRSEEVRKRFKKFVNAFELEGAREMSADAAFVFGVRAMSELGKRVGMVRTLRELGRVEPKDFPVLADLALKDASMTGNIIKPTKDEVIKVYQKAYDGESLIF